jgi:hypothetical protein
MEVIGLIDRIDDLILRGMTVPLTNQVRVERREVEEALSALRRALADEVAPVAPADRRQRARELLEPIGSTS